MKSGAPSDRRYREFSSAQGEPHPGVIVFRICDELEYFGGRNPNQHLAIDRYHPAYQDGLPQLYSISVVTWRSCLCFSSLTWLGA